MGEVPGSIGCDLCDGWPTPECEVACNTCTCKYSFRPTIPAISLHSDLQYLPYLFIQTYNTCHISSFRPTIPAISLHSDLQYLPYLFIQTYNTCRISWVPPDVQDACNLFGLCIFIKNTNGMLRVDDPVRVTFNGQLVKVTQQ